MPIVVATIIPKPGQIDAVEEAIRSVIPAVHEEDGCERYALHRGEDRLVFVEKWRDADALAVHSGGPTLASLGGKLADLIAAAPDVHVLESVPAGDPVKGVI